MKKIIRNINECTDTRILNEVARRNYERMDYLLNFKNNSFKQQGRCAGMFAELYMRNKKLKERINWLKVNAKKIL